MSSSWPVRIKDRICALQAHKIQESPHSDPILFVVSWGSFSLIVLQSFTEHVPQMET